MCDQMNCEQFNPCEMVGDYNQYYENDNSESVEQKFCPPTCYKCAKPSNSIKKEVPSSQMMCFDANQNDCYDLSTQQMNNYYIPTSQQQSNDDCYASYDCYQPSSSVQQSNDCYKPSSQQVTDYYQPQSSVQHLNDYYRPSSQQLNDCYKPSSSSQQLNDCYKPLTSQNLKTFLMKSSQQRSQICSPCESICCFPSQQQQHQNDEMCAQTYCPPPCEPSRISVCQEQSNCFSPSSDNCQNQCKRQRIYVQPPRRESCKPIASIKNPTIPMSSDTVYRKSFEGYDHCTAACCRAQAIRPNGLLRMPCGPFSKETITKLSYQPYCRVERVTPIRPSSHQLMGKGPIQGLTTQKHDYVPKYQMKRLKIFPRDNIKKLSGRFEKETIQKLSYMPVCPAPRDEMPWAKREAYKKPTVEFEKDTVTKLSYQPPGCFIDDVDCCPDYSNQCSETNSNCCGDMPRAAC